MTVTLKELQETYTYDQETGEFTRIGPQVGRPMGERDMEQYQILMVGGKRIYAHRAAWLMVHGTLPEHPLIIDHKNRVKGDNRIKNLRAVSRKKNAQNHKMFINNTSGQSGCSWDKGNGRWIAFAKDEHGVLHQKTFKFKGDAIAQRLAWEEEFGYTC